MTEIQRLIQSGNEDEILSHIYINCVKNDIKYYDINDDYSIDVNSSVHMIKEVTTELPLVFRNIKGSFICSYLHLTTLYGFPETCKLLDITYNAITSFEFITQNASQYIIGNLKNVNSFNHFPIDKVISWYPENLTPDDYKVYCESVKRNIKLKNILKKN